MDVRRDGVALYEAVDDERHDPKPKTPEKALVMAREYFDEWFPYLDTARDLVSQGRTKEPAFILHKSAERLYHCVLLVCTFYTPHVHNIGFLRTQAERLDRRLVEVWPREKRFDQVRFEKLKEAYVKARYSKHCRITSDELAWLSGCVEELGRTVHTICVERISKLQVKAEGEAA